MNRRFAPVFAPVFAAAFVLTGIASSPAFAHAALEATQPAGDSSATDITEISLTANEELLDLDGGTGFVLAVTDDQGRFYGDGCIAIDRATASMPIQLGEAGIYSVAYRVVSADGHPIEGEWSFTYTPAPDAAIGDAFAERPVCGEAQEPINSPEPTTAPSEMPSPGVPEDDGEIDVAPLIGLATIPFVVGSIWLLMRSLGKRDSEDHLN